MDLKNRKSVCHKCMAREYVYPAYLPQSRLKYMAVCEACCQDEQIAHFISYEEFMLVLSGTVPTKIPVIAGATLVYGKADVIQFRQKVPTDAELWDDLGLGDYVSYEAAEELADTFKDAFVDAMDGDAFTPYEKYDIACLHYGAVDENLGLDVPKPFDVVITRHVGMRRYLVEQRLVHENTKWYGRGDTISEEHVLGKHVYSDWLHVNIMHKALTFSQLHIDECTARFIVREKVRNKGAKEGMEYAALEDLARRTFDISGLTYEELRANNTGFYTYSIRLIHEV